MRFLIILILSLIALRSSAQIIKSNAIMELNNMDFTTPCSSCSEWRYSRNTNFLYRWNGTSWIIYNPGSTLNLGLSMPTIFTVSPSTLTGSGTFNVTLNSQSQNRFLAAPSNASGVPTFRTLTPSDLAVAGGLSGTSSAGRLAFYSGTNTLTGDANLTWDNNDKSLSLGGSGVSSSLLTLNSTTRGILIPRMTTTQKNAIVAPATGLLVYDLTLGAFNVYNGSAWVSVGGGLPAGANGEVQFNNNGVFGASSNLFWNGTSLGVGTNAPLSGHRLDVNGTVRVRTGGGYVFHDGASGYKEQTNGYRFDNWNANLGDKYAFTIQYGERTSGALNIIATPNTINPTSGTAVFNMIGLAPTINQTGGANGITRGLYIAPTLTSAADWRSIQFDNNTGWGLYGNGTANNYLAGNLTIGNPVVAARLSVRGSGSDNNASSLLIQNSLARTLFSVRNDGLAQLGRNTAVTTQSVAQIEVVSDDTNTGLVLTPKGNGAIIAGPAPDGTVVGGNARGSYAVDLQTVRTNAAQVASGLYSFIGGGTQNTASNIQAVVGGGFGNSVTAVNAVIGGGQSNSITNPWSTIAGGRGNSITTSYCFIGGGQDNINQGSYAAIGAGIGNVIYSGSGASNIDGGRFNATYGANSTITGGTYGQTRLEGQRAHATNRFTLNSDAQTSDIRVMRSVTGPFNGVLSLDGADTTKLAVLSTATTTNGRIWNARIQCVATVVTQGTGTAPAGSSFIQTYDVGIKRIGNTTTLIGGAPIATSATGDNEMSGANFIITADDTNEALKVEFQPPSTVGSDTVIRAIATIYLTELGY